MTEVQFFGGLLLAFTAGIGFGVWCSVSVLRASRRRWRQERQLSEPEEGWNFQPVRNDNFDPSKHPEFPMGDSAGESPPQQLMITHSERPMP